MCVFAVAACSDEQLQGASAPRPTSAWTGLTASSEQLPRLASPAQGELAFELRNLIDRL